MIKYEYVEEPETLIVSICCQLSLNDISQQAFSLENKLLQMSPGFLLIVDYGTVKNTDIDVTGVLYYLSKCAIEARPHAIVYIREPHLVDEKIIGFTRLLAAKQTRFCVSTRAEIDNWLFGVTN